MAKWDEMKPEEREQYVNQDVVASSWREIPASDIMDRMDGRETWATMFRSCGYLSEDSELHRLLSPVEVECIRLFYGEGQSCSQIASRAVVLYIMDGKVVKRRPFTKNTVKMLLRSARKTLMSLCGQVDEKGD